MIHVYSKTIEIGQVIVSNKEELLLCLEWPVLNRKMPFQRSRSTLRSSREKEYRDHWQSRRTKKCDVTPATTTGQKIRQKLSYLFSRLFRNLPLVVHVALVAKNHFLNVFTCMLRMKKN